MDKNFPENEIQAIVERYMNGTCSREELGRLLEFARSDKNVLFSALRLQWEKISESSPEEKPHFDRVFVSIMKEARSLEQLHGDTAGGRGQANKTGKVRRLVIKLVAAASVVLCIYAAALWLQNRGERSATIAHGPAKTILPGQDRAILTLADGTQIALDTARNGSITSQGDARVVKVDGLLHYNAAATGEAEPQVYNTITTPRGGQYRLVLADGSKVWLNASSSLKFPAAFTGDERNVELSGEGYFEVTRDPAHPFHVKTGKTEVTVLGTHFNINSYADEGIEKTTLIEGKVAVNTRSARVTLAPGQQAAISAGQDNIAVVQQVNLDEVLAWKNGLFLFNGADLETVMGQVARWYDVTVVYEGKINETISGSLPRSGDIRQLLKILEATGKVTFRINGNVITVKPN